jgi:oxygen-dependent protoporphyrinogen oxidase
VVLAYARDEVPHPMLGSGFVVPRKEGLTITAGSFVSSKWPQRAPREQALLRAFLGGARDPDAVDRSDESLIGAAVGDLSAVLGIRHPPSLTRVYRWRRASPQQEVGHLARVARIDERLARLPGLFLSGTGVRGVGIPDCIADGRATAARIAEALSLRPASEGA